MVEMFHGPRLKIERAKQHISDLHSRLNTFATSDYYRLDIEKDSDSGHDILTFTIIQPLPEDVALIIGDAIHNLRSALDFAVSELVLQKTGARSKYAKFPFRPSKNELESALKGGDISQAPKAVLDFILDEIKPYEGGNATICALHKLDILDKHMLLLPIAQVGALLGASFKDDRQNTFKHLDLYVEAGKVLFPFATVGNLRITDYGKPTIFLLFADGMPLQGQLVLPTLSGLTKDISHIVERFGRISKI
jgi:hypothetical protein